MFNDLIFNEKKKLRNTLKGAFGLTSHTKRRKYISENVIYTIDDISEDRVSESEDFYYILVDSCTNKEILKLVTPNDIMNNIGTLEDFIKSKYKELKLENRIEKLYILQNI